MNMRSLLRSSLFLWLCLSAAASAQSKFNGFGVPDASRNQAPPRDLPLVEVPSSALSNVDSSRDGKMALSINPDKWRHAETEHFIIHFRRVTEATKVIHQVEYNLWYVADFLKCPPDRYAGKSHVYVFADTEEWKKFLLATNAPPWSASFAYGSNLFLNVRGNDTGQLFDAETLAHETTHAVVARIFPSERWPVWLSEGFAEYMGEATVSARTGTTLKSRLSTVQLEAMPLSELTKLETYPTDEIQVTRLYKSAEKLVRYLSTKLPAELLPHFIRAVLDGDSLEVALTKVYGDRIKSYDAFQRALQYYR